LPEWQEVGLVEQMPAQQLGVIPVCAQNAKATGNDLAQKRFANRAQIHQVNSATGQIGQARYQRHLAFDQQRFPPGNGDIQITVRSRPASRHRPVDDGKPKIRLLPEVVFDLAEAVKLVHPAIIAPGEFPLLSVPKHVIEIEGYAYLVPFVESEDEVFLETVIPSRKASKTYLRGSK